MDQVRSMDSEWMRLRKARFPQMAGCSALLMGVSGATGKCQGQTKDHP